MIVLPGYKPKDGRAKFPQVAHAFIAGDPELKTEVDNNAEIPRPIEWRIRSGDERIDSTNMR